MESNRFAFLIIILIALYVLAPIDLMPGCLIDDLAAVIFGFSAYRNTNNNVFA